MPGMYSAAVKRDQEQAGCSPHRDYRRSDASGRMTFSSWLAGIIYTEDVETKQTEYFRAFSAR